MPTPIYPSWNDKEYDLLKKMTENTALIADYEIGDVASVAGTAGNVLVNGGTAAATGNITLSLPTALTSITSINGTAIPSSKTLVVTTDKISVLAATTSAELASKITDETGTGSLVFANTPTLVTPNIGAATGTSVNLSGAGTFGGNLTTNGDITRSGSGISVIESTSSSAAGFGVLRLSNSGASGRSFDIASGGSSTGAGTASLLYIYDNTAGAVRWSMNGSGNITQSGNLTVSGTGTSSVGGVFGVGTTSPAQALHVVDTSANFQLRLGSTGNFTYDLGRSGVNGYFQFYGNQASLNGYIFSGVDGEKMRLHTSGNLLLKSDGIDSGQKLQVAGNAAISLGATTSAATDLLINPTTKASSNLIDAQVNGTSKFKVDYLGYATFAGRITDARFTTDGNAGVRLGTGLEFASAVNQGSDIFLDRVAAGQLSIGASYTHAETSGAVAQFTIKPTYNQTSGTAANTDLLINRTQTAVGSGAQNLIDAQVDGTSKFSVNNSGAIAIGNTVNTVSPTSPNRTITMVIGGTTYYIAAKTTND